MMSDSDILRRFDDTTGLAAIGLALPSLAVPLDELATARGVDPAKYRLGLGCRHFALCDETEDAVSLGVAAARRAIAAWGGDLDEIGLLGVGTETAKDMSRPLSAWIAHELGLSGMVRSYEVKHACYGGTLALRQALEWRWSGVARGKAALVVCTDVALYAPEHPGEPTQGAAAVAMIVAEPSLLRVARASYAYSQPAFDFWRPVGDAYPSVDGPLSLRCYKDAAESAFRQWAADDDAPFCFDECEAFAFHTPFPKMVRKGFVHAASRVFGLDEETAARRFEAIVEPALRWNQEVGNCYTASTWLSLASGLVHSEASHLAAFSYGSGCGAELLLFERAPSADCVAIARTFDDYRRDRTLLDAAGYLARREAEASAAAAAAE